MIKRVAFGFLFFTASAWALNGGSNIQVRNGQVSVTGTIPVGNGGTGATSFTARRCVESDASGTVLQSADGACGTVTVNVEDYGVDCTADTNPGTAADSTTAMQAALDAGAGGIVYVPPGCVMKLANPGDNGISLQISNNTTLYCADGTAGFKAATKACKGGRYIGAACTLDADCLGGTTGDCAGAVYTGSSGVTNTMLAAKTNGSLITILNCGFWVGQAEPNQRCTGSGTNNGKACYQYCSNATSSGNGAGFRCNVDGDCTGGTCVNRSDCTANAGNTGCDTAPQSASGSGGINVIDLAQVNGLVTNVTIDSVSIYDHFKGGFGIYAGANSLITNTNVAKEINGCANLASSNSWQTIGLACYGPGNVGTNVNTQPQSNVTYGIRVSDNTIVTNSISRAGSSTSARAYNAQSTTGVRIARSTVWPLSSNGPGKASTGVSYFLNNSSRVDDSDALFVAASGTGIRLTGTQNIAYANHIGGSFTNGINVVGANNEVGKNLITPTSGVQITAGIVNSGADTRIENNTILVVTTTTTTATTLASSTTSSTTTTTLAAYAIDIEAVNAYLAGNYIEAPGGGNGLHAAIRVNGSDALIEGNHISSVANNTLPYLVVMDNVSGMLVKNNTLAMPKTAAVWLRGNSVTGTLGSGGNWSVQGNTIYMYVGLQISGLQPIALLDDNLATQGRFSDNLIQGGWHVFDTGNAFQITNVTISNNRTILSSGTPFVASGPGVLMDGNYVNAGGGTASLSCQETNPATWTVGGVGGRGGICFSDADCNGKLCLPEARFASLGSTHVAASVGHNSIRNSIIYDGLGPTKQCTGGSGSPDTTGSQCIQAGCSGTDSCNANGGLSTAICQGGAGTCQGGANPGQSCTADSDCIYPQACTSNGHGFGGVTLACCTGAGVGGSCTLGGSCDHGKFCCTRTGATCGYRQPTDMIRVPEYDSAAGPSEIMISSNHFLLSNDHLVGIDFVPSGTSGGNAKADNITVLGNYFAAVSSPSDTTGIRFPSTYNALTNINVIDNNFNSNYANGTQIVNWQHGFGSLKMPNMLTLTGGCIGTGTNTGKYLPMFGIASACQNSIAPASSSPGYIPTASGTIWSVNCWLDDAPGTAGSTKKRTFQVEKAGVLQNMQMVILETATYGTPTTASGGTDSQPVNFNAGDVLAVHVQGANTPTTTNAWCTVVMSLNSF